MNAFRRPHLRTGRDLGPLVLARWLLVLLVAFDLVGSPFHTHLHDLGFGGFGSHALHAGESSKDSNPVYVETDDRAVFAHSLAALLSAGPQLGKWQPAAVTAIHALASSSSPAILTPASGAWRSSPARIPNPNTLHLRPDGRAPPQLHI